MHACMYGCVCEYVRVGVGECGCLLRVAALEIKVLSSSLVSSVIFIALGSLLFGISSRLEPNI